MTAWYIQRPKTQGSQTQGSQSQQPNKQGPPTQGTASQGPQAHDAGSRDAGHPRVADEIGPLRPAELLNLVRSGEVTPETQIRKDDSGWFNASAVGGLFEAARRPTIEHFCPACNAPIPEPPCGCPSCGRDVHKARTRITEHGILSDQAKKLGAQSSRSVQRWLQRIKKKKKDE